MTDPRHLRFFGPCTGSDALTITGSDALTITGDDSLFVTGVMPKNNIKPVEGIMPIYVFREPERETSEDERLLQEVLEVLQAYAQTFSAT